MIRSMSRLANPYDNASCKSFMKTLKRDEIYANEYRDLDHLRENIAVFIDTYYNRVRLHSALGYKPPEEFERAATPEATSQAATMSFFRHEEIYRPMWGSLSRSLGAATAAPHPSSRSVSSRLFLGGLVSTSGVPDCVWTMRRGTWPELEESR